MTLNLGVDPTPTDISSAGHGRNPWGIDPMVGPYSTVRLTKNYSRKYHELR